MSFFASDYMSTEEKKSRNRFLWAEGEQKTHWDDFFSAVNKNLKKMKDNYGSENFIIGVFNKDRHLLKLFGKKSIVENFQKKHNINTGDSWNPEKVGENVVDSVLKNGRYAVLLGEEHQSAVLKNWYTAAFPIFDFQDNLVGVMSFITFSDEEFNQILPAVNESIDNIKNQIKMKKLEAELDEKNRFEEAIANQVSEGIIFIDKNAVVKFINKAGAKILKVNLEDCIGKHIKEIVDFRPVILDVLKSGKGYVDKEFFLKSKGELLHFIKSATVIKDDNGNIKGVLDTFREIKRVKKMVNVMTGAQASFCFDDIIGESEEINKSKRIARIAAESDSNVLITGRTGTGKELFAQSIHRASGRQDGPFLAINCSALPMKLIESELFGYVEGSFTGASKGGRPGKFEMANGGTIFLDEIGEMPLNMQVKLLRVIQERKLMRIGGSEVIPIDVRIIAATNKDLSKEVEKNNFRGDLYYRLNVLNINIPELKDRGNDIRLLANHFLTTFAEKLNKDISGFTEHAMNYLEEKSWPGNVRELENCIERLVNFAQDEMISYKDIVNFQHGQNEKDEKSNGKNEFLIEKNSFKEILSLNDMEKEYIKRVLSVCDNNVSEAARRLGVSRTTIYKNIN
ncbi:MAG: sigma-54 interaction domain-containing protein [Bacillota bacterium]